MKGGGLSWTLSLPAGARDDHRFRRVSQVVAALAAIAVLGRSSRNGSSRGHRDRRSSPETPARTRAACRWAVLPFENRSGDKQQEYLSDGLSEELMHALGKVVRVSPRASAFKFKGQGGGAQDYSQQLHVTHVIDGNVRQSGNRDSRARAAHQLLRPETRLGPTNTSSSMSDVFGHARQHHRAIVGALRVRLTGGAKAHLEGSGTKSVEAFELYIKGRLRRTSGEPSRTCSRPRHVKRRSPRIRSTHGRMRD
jgi:serine/threonine-protein kinase